MNYSLTADFRGRRAYIDTRIRNAGIDKRRIIFRARVSNFLSDCRHMVKNWQLHRRAGVVEIYDTSTYFVEYHPCSCRRCMRRFSPVVAFINAMRESGKLPPLCGRDKEAKA